ncbi:hypothetical protein AVEN_219425-1 [Araneus ventricosus]|uniref:Uncharacterized protein n=1 Tax=Araneus ventricosus TaxID=182803 RepID=A0A4Y2P442_ARAVE|nr:hypothetical protein AVEN_219425-1 [Araneus ventricosus]
MLKLMVMSDVDYNSLPVPFGHIACELADENTAPDGFNKEHRKRQESGDVSQRGHQGQATVPTKRKLGAAGSSKENVPAKKPRVSTTDARLKRMASRKTAKVACPKKDDDERFKEALMRAKLQLVSLQ